MVGVDGAPLGIVPTSQALLMAEAAEVDLVEIAAAAEPPVCRLMDFGKFKYQEQKKQHEAKQNQKQIQVKEIKFRPSTDDGDYNIKMRNLIKFLAEGDKAKITLRFRGREMAHQEFGQRLLERVRNDLLEHAIVEQFPKMEGRQLIMMLAPKKKDLLPKKAKDSKVEGSKPEAKSEMKSEAKRGTEGADAHVAPVAPVAAAVTAVSVVPVATPAAAPAA